MDLSSLPDIYNQSMRAASPRDEGVYIRQITSAQGITTPLCTYFVRASAKQLKPDVQWSAFIYNIAYHINDCGL